MIIVICDSCGKELKQFRNFKGGYINEVNSIKIEYEELKIIEYFHFCNKCYETAELKLNHRVINEQVKKGIDSGMSGNS